MSGCSLEFAGKFYVDFGWDYYMYVGTSSEPAASLEHVKKQGLFAHAISNLRGRRSGGIHGSGRELRQSRIPSREYLAVAPFTDVTANHIAFVGLSSVPNP